MAKKSSQEKAQRLINRVEEGEFKKEIKRGLEEIQQERESENCKKLMTDVFLMKKRGILEDYKHAKFFMLKDEAIKKIKEASNHNSRNGNGQTEEKKEKIKKICQELYEKTEKIRLLKIENFLN